MNIESFDHYYKLFNAILNDKNFDAKLLKELEKKAIKDGHPEWHAQAMK